MKSGEEADLDASKISSNCAGDERELSYGNDAHLLLEHRWLREWPVGLFLMAEDDVFENGFGDAELLRDFFVELGALGRDGGALYGVLSG